MTSLLNHLRAGTRAQHTSIEELVPIFTPGFSLSQYESLLGKFFGFYSGFDSLLRGNSPMTAIMGDLFDTARVAWLRADLEYLGYSNEAISNLAVCSDFPALTTSAACLGAAYVIEGSSLGGQIIARRLKGLWGLEVNAGATFFTGYGEDTGPRWKQFTDVLCSHANGHDEAAIVQAAVETFDSMSAWLSRKAPPPQEAAA